MLLFTELACTKKVSIRDCLTQAINVSHQKRKEVFYLLRCVNDVGMICIIYMYAVYIEAYIQRVRGVPPGAFQL